MRRRLALGLGWLAFIAGLVTTVVAGVIVLGGPARAQKPSSPPDLVLRGEITGADHQTYKELPFEVPAGTARVTVAFQYTGRDQRTVIDLGLADPAGFRGWSGGNKAQFTVGESFATPSYRAGPVLPGTWKLILGIPNIRKGATSSYEARIWLARAEDGPAAFRAAAADAPAWRRGDFHTHTGHSDGSCAAASGARVPCPVHLTVEAAIRAGLDFVAVTDHNTASHFEALAELAPYYDQIAILPGSEITTFFGHANVVGQTDFVDFQLAKGDAAEVDALIGRAHARGAIVSINHPGVPSGESCMGCGWTAASAGAPDAVEVVNGATWKRLGKVEPYSGFALWTSLLDQGRRVTAIAGSDNHDATAPASAQVPVGTPATVVWSAAATPAAILDGVRSGRVFIDLTGAPQGGTPTLLDLAAHSGGDEAVMGGTITVAPDAALEIAARVSGVAGGDVQFSGPDGELGRLPLAGLPESGGARVAALRLDPGKALAWVRADVRSEAGDIVLIGNPIYVARK